MSQYVYNTHNTTWKVRAYNTYARVVDVSDRNRTSEIFVAKSRGLLLRRQPLKNDRGFYNLTFHVGVCMDNGGQIDLGLLLK